MTRTDIQSFTDADTGRYFVTTSHSSYDIDLNRRTLSRVTARGNSLCADGHEIDLVSIGRCEVGESAVFWLAGLADGAFTNRVTTPVQSIEAVE